MKKQRDLLIQTENHWLPSLFSYNQKHFAGKALLSHDHLHHARVWKHACDIIEQLNKIGLFFSKKQLENLMLAVFFHDIGMAFSTAPDHGVISKDMAVEYIQENLHTPVDSYTEALFAIEHHDDKSYVNAKGLHGNNKDLILAILSIADDLDALGAIGVYRYAEIYMLRGIKEKELSAKVLANAENRFHHFEENMKTVPDFVQEHTLRYHYLKTFYEKLANEINTKGTNKEVKTGYRGIIHFFSQVIEQKLQLFDALFALAIEFSEDKLFHLYIDKLKHEF